MSNFQHAIVLLFVYFPGFPVTTLFSFASCRCLSARQ